MAKINCHLKWTGRKLTVTYAVARLDPNDEVTMMTDENGSAIEWNFGSPFTQFDLKTVEPLPLEISNPQPRLVIKTTPLAPHVAQCGHVDASGNFTSWPGDGFPPVGHEPKTP